MERRATLLAAIPRTQPLRYVLLAAVVVFAADGEVVFSSDPEDA